MAYTPQTWTDGDATKPLSAARLAVMETGIDDADTRLTTAEGSLTTLSGQLTTATNRITALEGAGRMRGLTSGRYYPIIYTQASATAIELNRLRLSPFFVDESTTFDRIGAAVTTAAASATLRWAVYGDSSGLPGSLLFDTGVTSASVPSGAVTSASTTGFKEATISWSASAGKYWVGLVGQGAICSVYWANNVSVPGIGYASGADIVASSTVLSYAIDSVTGNVPASFTGFFSSYFAPLPYLRKA